MQPANQQVHVLAQLRIQEPCGRVFPRAGKAGMPEVDGNVTVVYDRATRPGVALLQPVPARSARAAGSGSFHTGRSLSYEPTVTALGT